MGFRSCALHRLHRRPQGPNCVIIVPQRRCFSTWIVPSSGASSTVSLRCSFTNSSYASALGFQPGK
jgi:hypothetical protein